MRRTLFFRNMMIIILIVSLAGCGDDDSAPVVQVTPGPSLPGAGGGPVADIPKTLSVTKEGLGSGEVVSSPTVSIICGAVCSAGALNAWVPIATPPTPDILSGRYAHTAVWTGTEMIIWGGWEGSFSNTGAKYNPATNQWTAIATPPSTLLGGRDQHSAVWTGTEMIIWGGSEGGTGSNTGAKYNPETDTWATMTPPPPSILEARMEHSAVWTGSEMIIWGGFKFGTGPGDNIPVNTGAKYNPETEVWTPITNPSSFFSFGERERHSAVWTGTEMIVWGGSGRFSGTFFNTGAKYNPVSNLWTPTAVPPQNIIQERGLHSAVWSGEKMIIWGGFELGTADVKTGAEYDPATNTWAAILAPLTFSRRAWHSAVWTGTEMIVWGGNDTANQTFNDGSSFRGGEILTLTATADPGSSFGGWSLPGGSELSCPGIGPCVVNVDGNQSVSAIFN